MRRFSKLTKVELRVIRFWLYKCDPKANIENALIKEITAEIEKVRSNIGKAREATKDESSTIF